MKIFENKIKYPIDLNPFAINFIDDWLNLDTNKLLDSGENCSGGNLVSNYFWTSDETDSETQKCYEDDRSNTPAGSKSKKSIVDCPKDLYPMVQALCIKER